MWRRVFTITGIVTVLGFAGYATWRVWPDLREIADFGSQGSNQNGPVLRFAVIGDNHGATEIYRQTLDLIADENVSFLLNLADTSEYGTAEEFAAVKKLEERLPFPTYHAVGNHDIKADPSRGLFTQAFEQPPCSAVSVDFVRLVWLDNADRKVGFSDECLETLEQELAGAGQSTVLLAYHRPFDLPLGDVLGDDETPTARQSDTRMIDLLAEYGNVSYIFSGHLHTYLPYTFHGIPAVVSGGGGDPAQSVLGGSQSNYFHYLVVTVRGRNVSTQVRRIQLKDYSAGLMSPSV